jgi:glyceraldehyde-3-phosphate dehydrogenase (NADP+)
VFPDADLDLAAQAVVEGAFGVAGQNCLSVQRVFVASRFARRFAEQVARDAAELHVGSKTDPRTDVGPLIDVRAATRVEEWVEEARQGGAVTLAGGHRDGASTGPRSSSTYRRSPAS